MKIVDKFLLYYFTIINLKFIQIFFRINKLLFKPQISNKLPFQVNSNINNLKYICTKNKCFYNRKKLVFLNREILFDLICWSPKGYDKLWIYNLNYFDFINDCTAFKFKKKYSYELITDWIKNNPYKIDNIGWEPYPTSLRIVNWTKWYLSGNKFDLPVFSSIYKQLTYISQNIEYHILGNHLIANAKALIYGSVLFSNKKILSIRKKGLSLLFKELDIQILADGGHFERSPMYHSIILEDILDLINLSRSFQDIFSFREVNYLTELSKKMLNWLTNMIHPDNKISFFNDSAHSVAISPQNLFNYANQLDIYQDEEKLLNEISNIHLKDSGYVKVMSKKIYFIGDIGDLGPDYQLGHAHADTLSFELSIDNHRMIVNGGTSTYECSKIRFLERSTKSHSTLEINKKNSSEIWSNFRVAKRAYVTMPKLLRGKKSLEVECSHNGYKSIFNNIQHTRNWKFYLNKLIITDVVIGKISCINSRFILHPKVKFSIINKNKLKLIGANGCVVTFNSLHSNIKIEKCYYSSEFGKRKITNCISIDFKTNKNVVEINC